MSRKMKRKRKRKRENNDTETSPYEPVWKKRKLNMSKQSDVLFLLNKIVKDKNLEMFVKDIDRQLRNQPERDEDEDDDEEEPPVFIEIKSAFSRLLPRFRTLVEKFMETEHVCWEGEGDDRCSCHGPRSYQECSRCEDSDLEEVHSGFASVVSSFSDLLNCAEEEMNFGVLEKIIDLLGEEAMGFLEIEADFSRAEFDVDGDDAESIHSGVQEMCEELCTVVAVMIDGCEGKDKQEKKKWLLEKLKELKESIECDELRFDADDTFEGVFEELKQK